MGTPSIKQPDSSVNENPGMGEIKVVTDHETECLLKSNKLEELYARNPMGLFQKWYTDAFRHNVVEPYIMSLATCNSENKPRVRIVGLGLVNDKGFTFATHVESRKHEDIRHNQHVAASFYWSKMDRTVRIEGRAEETDDNSQTFHSWPRVVQIAEHSTLLPNGLSEDRQAEGDEMRALMQKFAEVEVIPQPESIKAFLIIPESIEFLQIHQDAPQDRVVFKRNSSSSNWEYNYHNRY